ncbi:MAG: argininosuccinate lyase [Patescibacteria group bacterium]
MDIHSSPSTHPLWREQGDTQTGSKAVGYAAGEDILYDQHLIMDEIATNEAHLVMLVKTSLITREIARALLVSLEGLRARAEKNEFILDPALEDVHSNVEQYLIVQLGMSVGGYLRLGIARNDQVYTDMRRYMRRQILMILRQIVETISALSEVAAEHSRTIMPGYTHLRISQPITVGHWLTSKAYHLLDDADDLCALYPFVNRCPLGIFEMAGTHLPIDRSLTARLLGFEGTTGHSLYTANVRGELEARSLARLSQLAMHMRRSMTEVILFSTHEFGLFTIDDAYTTGGTAQPNLKNPDAAEVLRANCARVYALEQALIHIMDSLPSGFNRDSQQTKPLIFEGFRLIDEALPVYRGIMATLRYNPQRMEEVANINFATAPDLSVQLAIKGGVNFREAYQVVKAIIKKGILKEGFHELTPSMVRIVAQELIGKPIEVTTEDIMAVATARASVSNHVSEGGPAPQEVERMIGDIREKTSRMQEDMSRHEYTLSEADDRLQQEVQDLIRE